MWHSCNDVGLSFETKGAILIFKKNLYSIKCSAVSKLHGVGGIRCGVCSL